MLRLLYLLLLSASVFSHAASARSPATIKQVEEQGKLRGLPQLVDFEAQVTFVHPVWSFVFFEDDSGAIFGYGRSRSKIRTADVVQEDGEIPARLASKLEAAASARDLEAGDVVRVQGLLQKGDLEPVVNLEHITLLGKKTVRTPRHVDIGAAEFGEFDAHYVQLECEVKQIVLAGHHAQLVCEEGENRVYVSVSQWGLSIDDVEHLLHRRIRCHGSLGVQLGTQAFTKPGSSSPKIQGFRVFVRSLDAVETLDDADDLPSAVTSKIGQLASMPGNRFVSHGQVSFVHPGSADSHVVAFDERGAARISMKSTTEIYPGAVFRIIGRKEKLADGRVKLHGEIFQNLGQYILEPPAPQSVSDFAQNFSPNARVRVEGKPGAILRSDNYLSFPLSHGDETIDVKVLGDAARSLENQKSFSLGNPSFAKRVRVIGVGGPSELQDSAAKYQISVSEAGGVELTEPAVVTRPVMLFGVGFCMVALVVASVWVTMFRSLVAEKTKDVNRINAQLRSSYESIEDGVLAIDRDQVVLAANHEFRRLTQSNVRVGRPLEKIPTLIADRLKAPKEFLDFWQQCVEEPNVRRETTLEFADVDRSRVILRVSPIKRIDQQPEGQLVILRDDTDKNRLQAELMHSNKLEAIGRLVGGVAHDFNNVLMAVAANLTIAQLDETATVGSIKPELAIAEDAAYRGADIVRRLLTFSSKNTLHLESQNVNAMISHLRELVRHTFDARIRFEWDLDPADPVVSVDSTAIEQVLLNLYVNARDAMPHGGTITTVTRVLDNPATNEPVVTITVVDEGMGVPEKIRDRIFEPFFTTKDSEAGTGLGLSISYRVVMQHGGMLKYKPSRGGGSEFEFMLPICTSAARPTSTRSIDFQRGSGDILVVDDEDVVRTAARGMLERHGYHTIGAATGDVAIEIIEKRNGNLDAVLLDLTMPGMSGVDALEIIRNRWPDIAVILCSGYFVGDLSLINNVKGADAEIRKPYSMQQLITTLAGVLSKKRESETLRADSAHTRPESIGPKRAIASDL